MDTPLSESRFSEYFDGWVDENRLDDHHDEVVHDVDHDVEALSEEVLHDDGPEEVDEPIIEKLNIEEVEEMASNQEEIDQELADEGEEEIDNDVDDDGLTDDIDADDDDDGIADEFDADDDGDGIPDEMEQGIV